MSENKSHTALWLSETDLNVLFTESKQKSRFADILLEGMIKSGNHRINTQVKILLREIYCLIESNIAYFDERLRVNPHEKDGSPGFVIEESDLLGLTTFSLSMKKIASELLEQGISLQVQ